MRILEALVTAGASVHFLQELAHRIELSPEAFPISGLQSLHCLIVAIKRLPGLTCRRARQGYLLRRAWDCWRSRGFHEQSRQGFSERFLHHDMFTVSCDHAFQLRQMSLLGPQAIRRGSSSRSE